MNFYVKNYKIREKSRAIIEKNLLNSKSHNFSYQNPKSQVHLLTRQLKEVLLYRSFYFNYYTHKNKGNLE